jgi:phosphoglycerate dehydrogenase-like enzyme
MKHLLLSLPLWDPGVAALNAIPGITNEYLPPQDEAVDWDAETLARADALVCRIPPANLAAASRLRWVQVESVGFNQLLPHRLGERGIAATNARGIFDVPIAEWNVAMMINLLRDLRGLIHNQEHATWDRAPRFQRELRGRTVGIWGYGGIGRETARLAKGLGLKVHVLTRSGKATRESCYRIPGTGDPDGALPNRYFSDGERLEFLSGIDFLILALPLTPQTQGMIGEAELRALGPNGYLLNPARGPIVQEAALVTALREYWIAGAALDTHYTYPMPPDHPLWGMPNVIMTPHISGSTGSDHFLERIWTVVLENARRFSEDRPLLNVIAPCDLDGNPA